MASFLLMPPFPSKSYGMPKDNCGTAVLPAPPPSVATPATMSTVTSPRESGVTEKV